MFECSISFQEGFVIAFEYIHLNEYFVPVCLHILNKQLSNPKLVLQSKLNGWI